MGLTDQVGLGQAFTDLQTSRQHEGIGNTAAHDQLIDVAGQTLQDGQLGADFTACHNSDQRPPGLGKGFADGVDFGGQQRPGAADRRVLSDAVGGALGPVGGAEGVMHKNVTQGSKFAGQYLAVGLLAHI